MKYLWDTDTCIYLLNGNSLIEEKLRSIGDKDICTTIVNIAELKFGAYNSSQVESNLRRIERLASILTVLNDFSNEIATIFAKNKAILRKDGIIISDFDLLIGSFALAYNLIIVTNNIEHFRHIPNIKIENWVK